jgi:hypothetical protein
MISIAMLNYQRVTNLLEFQKPLAHEAAGTGVLVNAVYR